MDTVLLSIVVPVFNAEKELPVFLESIAAAGLQDTELLLVDDGSSDLSAEIAESYANAHKSVYFFARENAGPAAARNFGLKAARGQYVAFMDSDDYVEPAQLRKTAALLPQYDAEIWFSDFHRVDGSGRILDRVYQIDDAPAPITEPDYMSRFLSGRECVWNVWRYIYNRQFLIGNELFFRENARIAEDMEFTVRALTAVKRPAFYHAPYYNYRVNYSDTLTRRYTAERVRQFTQMACLARQTIDRCDAAYAPLLLKKLAREYVLNLAVCRQVPERERKEALGYYKETWKLLDGAGGIIAGCARISAGILGLRGTSGALCVLKWLKRAARRLTA